MITAESVAYRVCNQFLPSEFTEPLTRHKLEEAITKGVREAIKDAENVYRQAMGFNAGESIAAYLKRGQEAIEAEREACAKIAEGHGDSPDCEGGQDCWRNIAKHIRART